MQWKFGNTNGFMGSVPVFEDDGDVNLFIQNIVLDR